MQTPTQILTSFSLTSTRLHAFRAVRDSDLFCSGLPLMASVLFFFLSLVLSSSGSCAFFRASKFVASPQFDRVHLKTLTIFFKAPEKSAHLHTQATQSLLILCTVMRKLQVSSTRPPLQQQYTRFILKRNLLFFSTVLQSPSSCKLV